MTDKQPWLRKPKPHESKNTAPNKDNEYEKKKNVEKCDCPVIEESRYRWR